MSSLIYGGINHPSHALRLKCRRIKAAAVLLREPMGLSGAHYKHWNNGSERGCRINAREPFRRWASPWLRKSGRPRPAAAKQPYPVFLAASQTPGCQPRSLATLACEDARGNVMYHHSDHHRGSISQHSTELLMQFLWEN
jgi:hypothetical protein